jgi:hypothetical protein
MEIITLGFFIIVLVYFVRDLVDLFSAFIRLNFLYGVSLVVLILVSLFLFFYYETVFLCDLLNNGIFN